MHPTIVSHNEKCRAAGRREIPKTSGTAMQGWSSFSFFLRRAFGLADEEGLKKILTTFDEIH